MVDELIRMFEYLKYGVAFMLVFIGAKLIISKVVEIPPSVVCGVLIGTLFVCMSASIFNNKIKAAAKDSTNGNDLVEGTPEEKEDVNANDTFSGGP
jgi:tellurite resistance protein TerC